MDFQNKNNVLQQIINLSCRFKLNSYCKKLSKVRFTWSLFIRFRESDPSNLFRSSVRGWIHLNYFMNLKIENESITDLIIRYRTAGTFIKNWAVH